MMWVHLVNSYFRSIQALKPSAWAAGPQLVSTLVLYPCISAQIMPFPSPDLVSRLSRHKKPNFELGLFWL